MCAWLGLGHQRGRRKLNFGILRGFADTLNSHLILGQVDTRVVLERIDDAVNHDNVAKTSPPKVPPQRSLSLLGGPQGQRFDRCLYSPDTAHRWMKYAGMARTAWGCMAMNIRVGLCSQGTSETHSLGFLVQMLLSSFPHFDEVN
jgi:hypothetical protein